MLYVICNMYMYMYIYMYMYMYAYMHICIYIYIYANNHINMLFTLFPHLHAYCAAVFEPSAGGSFGCHGRDGAPPFLGRGRW